MNKTIILSAICCCAALSCSVSADAQQTQRLNASKANEYGLIYTLPSTALQITIEAERTVRTPGEFYKYASRYLGTSEAVATPSESWRPVRAVITPVAIADPDAEQYLITLKGGASPFMMVNAKGLPLTINTDNVPDVRPAALPQPRKASPSPLDGPDARRALTAEMVQSSSLAKKAELAAARIMEIRQSRNDYLTGQADQMPDGEALKLIMSSLDSQEEALTAMFLGTEQTSTEVMTYTVVPNDSETNRVIARLSSTNGLVDADDLRGAPIYLNVDVIERGTLPANEKGEPRKMPKGGIAYRIPGTARVSVTFDGTTLANGNFEIAQFGVVYGLDPSLFANKKSPAYLIFNPLTGGISKLGTVE
ncbi:MAG: DUF4831 family protein [Muribaculaceae bacterium]|nr:DUF4831 family protein [Muribaculaceae bacterium]